jgi:deoxyhypusine synthase
LATRTGGGDDRDSDRAFDFDFDFDFDLEPRPEHRAIMSHSRDPHAAAGHGADAHDADGHDADAHDADSPHLRGPRIDPSRIRAGMTADDLIANTFAAYNAGRLREACRLYTEKMLDEDVTVGVSITGALTPAGLGVSALIPLIEAGFIDWIISTGANLYHDAHFGLGLALHQGNPFVSDVVLREDEVVRIYDIFFRYDVLLDTDAFFRQLIEGDEFQRTMSSAEFHHLCGKYVAEREKALGQTGETRKSLLAACYEYDVPVYTSSPGDSSIGMNVAAMELRGNKLRIDVNADVNETASIVLDAKRGGAGKAGEAGSGSGSGSGGEAGRGSGSGSGAGKSAVLILGGGSPKNFMLQTEPQIQEVMGIEEKGHDYFLQITDARPDTGGLSGATPAEAVSWGKVDPDRLPDAVVCYTDATIGLPLLTAYALARHEPREPKRLFRRRAELLDRLKREYEAALQGGADERAAARQEGVRGSMLDRDR